MTCAGAALIGLAGGMALSNPKRRRNPVSRLSDSHLARPRTSTAGAFGEAAKELAKGAQKVGELTSEFRGCGGRSPRPIGSKDLARASLVPAPAG